MASNPSEGRSVYFGVAASASLRRIDWRVLQPTPTAAQVSEYGNRPRMIAKASPDGKKIEFAFLDVKGNVQYGHMHGAVFTIVDENDHTMRRKK